LSNLLVAIAAVTGGRGDPVEGPGSQGAPVAAAFAGLPTHGYALGRADAPVTIDLYEDFQCPACRRWGDAVFPQLAANELRNGRARLVFHNFPFIGPESLAAARAGHAAASQDRFWPMWAATYAAQGRENSGALASARLVEIARSAGLDVARFKRDAASDATATAVDSAVASAQQLGVSSTPTLVVAGHLLVGASYEELSAAIAHATAD